MPNFCRYCGAKQTRSEAMFCAACGRPLPSEQDQTSPPQQNLTPILLAPEPAAARSTGARQAVPQAAAMETTHLDTASPQLTVQQVGTASQTAYVTQPQFVIGREPAADLTIASAFVSRRHAQIERRGDQYWITDLDSTNGTWVNGRRISNSQRLHEGDIIRIGDQQGNSVSLTFSSVGPQPASQTISLGSLNLATLSTATLGRDPACHIPLQHPTVSRQHARMDRTTQGHTIRDLGSDNGTFVNGRLLRGSHPLQNGDLIQIGPFKLVYDRANLAQYTSAGNYSLDARGLRRVVNIGSKFSLNRLLGKSDGTTKRVILNNISLSIQPREFVALVGGSGAGKSTLMMALNGFVPAEGQVLVNGEDLYKSFDAYRSILGYVPQDDILHDALTVNSALTYAAKLRLPDAKESEIERRVDDVLEQVEMSDHADKPINRLSGGQRKRVSIASELLADPGLFFLDEPTSGLDPGLEKKLMYTMRHLADAGRTIILVTHATANISQCTHVAFLAEGRLAYYGPPEEALEYFGVADFADIYSRLTQPADPAQVPLPPQIQPYYQQTLTQHPQSPPKTSELWARCYYDSPQYHWYVEARSLSSSAEPISSPVQPVVRRKGSSLKQFGLLAQRYLELIRRDAMSLVILLAVMPIIGLLLIIMAKEHDLVGQSLADRQAQIQVEIEEARAKEDSENDDETFAGSYTVAASAQRVLFVLALAANLLGLFAGAYEIVRERTIYARERMVNLKIGPYLFSKIVVLAAFSTVQCALILLVINLKVRYPEEGVLGSAVIEMYVTLVLASVSSICLAMLISSVVRSSSTVIYVILLMLFMQILFAGAFFELPDAARPLSYLTTTRWTLEALGSSVGMDELNERGVTCIEFENETAGRLLSEDTEGPCEEGQLEQALTHNYHINYDHTTKFLLRHWLALLLFAAVACSATVLVQKQKDAI